MLVPMGGPGTAGSHGTLCPSTLEREAGLTFSFSPSISGSFSGKGLSDMIFWIPSQPGMLSVTLRELGREKVGVF